MEIFEIYKRGQGKYTRLGTILGVMLIATVGAYALSGTLRAFWPIWIAYGIPTVIWLAIGAVVFWLVNHPSSADFLIATESEMKKVSWSSKKEIIGSTKVVIVFMIVIAAILFGVDVMFVFLFKSIGVSAGS